MTYNEFHKLRYQYVFNTLDPFRKNVEAEAIVEEMLIKYFEQWFTVYKQVYSDCGKNRCDILMYHKGEFAEQRPLIIEIKKDSVKQGSPLGEWCNQANRYSKVLFHGKKPLLFIFPQISGIYFEEGCQVSPHSVIDEDHHNINSFLYGAFCIGEVRRMKHHEKPVYQLIVNTKTLWTSNDPWVLNQKIHPYGH